MAASSREHGRILISLTVHLAGGVGQSAVAYDLVVRGQGSPPAVKTRGSVSGLATSSCPAGLMPVPTRVGDGRLPTNHPSGCSTTGDIDVSIP